MTLEEVPPGAQPTRMTPAASPGSSRKASARTQASVGMMANWATTPTRTGSGRLTTSAKSGGVRVRPMPNMMMPRATSVPADSGESCAGTARETANAARMRTGKTVTAMRAERSSALGDVLGDSRDA